MSDPCNPVLPDEIIEDIEREKEQAYSLYLDFVVDGTASMYSVYPAVYFAALHFLEGLGKYEVYPRLGITVIRNEKSGEKTETITFEEKNVFTRDMTEFLKRLRTVRLYGGGDDGFESVHTAIEHSLKKFPSPGRNKAVLVFTDAYGSEDYCDFTEYPLGQVLFFCTDQLSDEEFRFCFVREDGTYDEESSPMFLSFDKLLKPLSNDFLENVVKPLKDLMKGVSTGL